jgi:hypothetical protein
MGIEVKIEGSRKKYEVIMVMMFNIGKPGRELITS